MDAEKDAAAGRIRGGTGMQTLVANTARAGTLLKSILVFLTSMLPITENKGAITLGAAMKLKWYISWLAGAFGSYVVVPVIVFMKKRRDALLERMTERLKTKHPKLVAYMKKYGCAGLLVVISIPVSGIGCWFGAMAARFLKLDQKKACIAIFVGNVIGCFLTAMCVYGIFTGIRLLF